MTSLCGPITQIHTRVFASNYLMTRKSDLLRERNQSLTQMIIL